MCRACELFYYLKGGTVDYGVERSEKYGHSRFGHTYHQGEMFFRLFISIRLTPKILMDVV